MIGALSAERAAISSRARQRAGTLASWNTLVVAGIAAVAAGIRFWNIQWLGYSHWDEYYFIADAKTVGQIWPKGFGRIGWFVTPLTSYTDGTLFHFLGVHTWIPMAASALYGTAAAVAVYWLGSRLFGRAVGLIAAAVLATAEFSVMFSRMALADATFDFWLILSLLLIWLGFTRGFLRYYVLGGVSSGLLLNSKYDGACVLIFAVAWVLAEFAFDLLGRSQALTQLLSAYRVRIVGTAILVGIAIALFAPFLIKLAVWPGLQIVLTHNEANVVGSSVIKTPPTYLFQYFWLFTSAPTVLLALAGILAGVIRFTQADRFLLLCTAGWIVAIMLFPPYPREALSLLPPVAIWAGRAVLELYSWARGRSPRFGLLAGAAASLCVAAMLVGDAIPTAHALSLRTVGYKQAGAVAARYQANGDDVFVRTQPVALLYVKTEYSLYPTPGVEQALNEKGTRAVLMTDQTVSWYQLTEQFFQLNRDHLQVLQRIPNPMYDEVLLQPATSDRLAHLGDPPVDYRYITFWRVTGPLAFPPQWPR